MCMFCRSLFFLLYFFFWPLCCLFFFDMRILITHLASTNFSFGYCVVCSSSLRFTTSDYPFGISKLFFWLLCCLFFFDLGLLITFGIFKHSLCLDLWNRLRFILACQRHIVPNSNNRRSRSGGSR